MVNVDQIAHKFVLKSDMTGCLVHWVFNEYSVYTHTICNQIPFRVGGCIPYSKTPHFMVALLLVTVFAFWPSYFGQLSVAPWIHHMHGITGTLWILLIAVQSHAIHVGKRDLHRSMGRMLFVLVPVMVGAFSLVTWLGAQKSVGGHPFYEEIGHFLLTGDALLTFTTPLVVYLALRFRRSIPVHAALMISTVFGLLPPIIFRVFANYVPGLKVEGLDQFYKFEYSLYLSLVLTMAIALYLYFRNKVHGWPWLLAAGLIALMWGLYETFGRTELWTILVGQLAGQSPILVLVFGIVLGLLAVILGWRHGVRS